jgi:hypothetical protein
MANDQQKLNKEFTFAGRGTAAELVTELDQIAILEKTLKGRASLIRWVALAAFVVLLAPAIFFGALFIVLAVLVPTGLLVYSGFAGGSSILHDRVEFLRLILNMLQQDAGKRGRFEVLLRLRAKPETISEGPIPHNKRVKQKLLRDAWLSLSGRLSDGTAISESCTDLIRRRTKKNARGKTKTKDQRACLLRVQLNYDTEKYGDAAVAARALEKPFRLPDGAQMKAFTSTDKALAMKTILKSNPTVAGMHAVNGAMLLGAYRILNLARQRAAATGGTK